MKHLTILLLLALSTVACGKEVHDYGCFAPYVERFEAHAIEYDYDVHIDNLIFQFGDLTSKGWDGQCEQGGNVKVPTITINTKSWARMDDLSKEALIFHELGHCVLERGHNSETYPDGSPVSIMHPYGVVGATYKKNLDHYLRDLFKKD